MARRILGVVCLAWIVTAAAAQWQSVAPGIEYQEFRVAGPNDVYVARMDRSNLDCTIDSMIGQGRLTGGTERPSSQAARLEDAIGYWGQVWGQRYEVVVAINGDFYSGGIPTGGQICGGWYAKRFGNLGGGSGMAWQHDRDVFIGECVHHIPSKQKIQYPATGQSQGLDGVNRARGSNEIIVYTHHYDLTTGTDSSGVEVLVQMIRPAGIIPTPNGADGTVVEIQQNIGSAIIPFDHVVLSATGNAATQLLANVSIGAQVRVSQEITHYEHDCSTPYGWDWTKTYASIGGSFHYLKNGVFRPSSDPGATERHPRTAVAFNDTHIFYIVVDGRSAVSVGMSMAELCDFSINYLGAIEGLNQDGGGSSVMWVNGTVMNVPSDGSERPVANGLMMANVLPVEQVATFIVGDPVRAAGATPVRVGPGTNYATAVTVPAGTAGVVVDHALGGIRATNTYWWKVAFPAFTGWVPETSLLEGDCAGDYNGDGHLTAADLAGYAFCMLGPDVTFLPGHFCLAGDADNDHDIDTADFGTFQRCSEAP